MSISISWCPVDNAIGCIVYYSADQDSGFAPIFGVLTEINGGESEAQCGSTSRCFEMDFSGMESRIWFFKVVSIDGNRIESGYSNISSCYFVN